MSLYERLGVDPTADHDELKRAYRARARALHPDLNQADDASEAMSRINEAWAVLSDPGARRRYDETLWKAEPPPPPPVWVAPPGRSYDSDIIPEPALWGWARLFRPAVLIPSVLLIIFVVTAYAAHPGAGGSPPPSGSTTTVAGEGGSTGPSPPTSASPNLVGSCILNEPTLVQLVPCAETPNRVVAAVPAQGTCPTGTTGLVLQGQTEMFCAESDRP